MSTPVGRAAYETWDGLRNLTVPDWLLGAAQPELVCAALRRRVPELASGTLALRRCEVKQFRLRDDTGRWSGMYLLTVEGLPSGRPEAVAVWGSLIPPGRPAPDGIDQVAGLGSERWRCYLPELRLELEGEPPETALPALARLTDRQKARELLETSIRAGAPEYADLRIAACTPKVVRHKPGSRCTVLYQLEYPPGLGAGRLWPESVVAKTHRGNEGQNAYRAMRALWDSPLRRSGCVAIAEPLAFVPELKVLVQGPIREEQTVKSILRSALSKDTPEALERLHACMRRVARGLAELHRCEVAYGETVRWEDELAKLRASKARLAVHLPRHAEATTAFLARLESLAARHPADPMGPSHGTFRPSQVLVHDDDIGFVDFDGFCQAEPALDLALFMTEIKHVGLGRVHPDGPAARLARLEEICGVFLDTYTSFRPVSRYRIAIWEALDFVTLLQGAWSKAKPARLDTLAFLLERHPLSRDDEYRGAGGRP